MSNQSITIRINATTAAALADLAARCDKDAADLAATFVADGVESYRDQPEELAGTFAAV